MILTVTPNPALDLTVHGTGIEIGESNRVPTALVRAGGKGLNVARAARQAGFPVEVLTTVGGATGEQFRADLEASGLPARLVTAPGATRRSIAIVETDVGRTTVLNEQGALLPQPQVDALLAGVSARLAEARCVVVSGSLPPGVAADFPAQVVGLAAARAVPCVVDVTGDALLAAARAGASALKPNRRELAEATGTPDPVAGAVRLRGLGARLVFVSLGEDGMLVVAHGLPVVHRARLRTALRGNPTGAGDAAVAAIASCLASGEAEPVLLLRRAVAWSAAAVLMPQAGDLHPSYRDLDQEILVERLD